VTQENKAVKEEGPSGWRYKLGLLMFTVPVILFLAAPLLVPLLGLSAGEAAGLIGAILVAGEVVWFASIPLLGAKGFKALKSKMFSWIKPKQGAISRGRHRFGVALFFGSLLGESAVAGFIVYTHLKTSAVADEFSVFGLGLNDVSTLYVVTQFVFAVCFVSSVFVLGADFWERVRLAFTWPGDQGTEG
jgi:hypothetical protein